MTCPRAECKPNLLVRLFSAFLRKPFQRANVQFPLGNSHPVIYVNKRLDDHSVSDQQAREIKPMLVYCWASVADAGPALNQHRLNVLCLPGDVLTDSPRALSMLKPETSTPHYIRSNLHLNANQITKVLLTFLQILPIITNRHQTPVSPETPKHFRHQ